VLDTLLCDRCNAPIETDDAVSVIEGRCAGCRQSLKGLVQPLRADQLIAGKTLLEEADDFLDLPAPRFRMPEPAAITPVFADEVPVQTSSPLPKHPVEIAAKTPSRISAEFSETQIGQPLPSSGLRGLQPRAEQPVQPLKSLLYDASEEIARPIEAPPSPPREYSLNVLTNFPARPELAASPFQQSDDDRETAQALAKMAASPAAPPRKPKPVPRRDPDLIRALDATSPRIDHHRFQPPTPPFGTQPAPRHRRRRRDLLAGVSAGLVMTFAVVYYAMTVEAPENGRMTISAVTAPTNLSLRISPVNATVKLDGNKIGPTDSFGAIAFSLPPGDTAAHELEIAAPGYHTLKQAVSAYMGAPQALISLMRVPYELAVATTPPDAEIWIGGELRGKSPLTLMMDPSTDSELTIRRKGYAEKTAKITPPDSEAALALSYELARAGQLIAIATEPANATVRIDGQLKGQTPLRLELDSTYLGRNVEIAVVMDGFDNATTRLQIPEEGGGDALSASLALRRTLSRINAYTDPPGGRVVVAGRDFGIAPVEIEFDPQQTGKSVLVEASMSGTHFGRQEVTVPPPGEPTLLLIPLSFGAQRVVFALSIPRGLGAERFTLTDEITSQIQSLGPAQRFAVVAATDGAVETWPGGLSMESATSEQKVRAYDFIRAVRPASGASTDAILKATTAFQPTSVWLALEGDVEHKSLKEYGESLGSQQVSVNMLRATPLDDESAFVEWTTAHRGTFTLIGRDPTPILAADSNTEH